MHGSARANRHLNARAEEAQAHKPVLYLPEKLAFLQQDQLLEQLYPGMPRVRLGKLLSQCEALQEPYWTAGDDLHRALARTAPCRESETGRAVPEMALTAQKGCLAP